MKIADNHVDEMPQKVIASASISELQSSDIYLTVKARLFDIKANLNGVRVTEAFIDEIVNNEDKYVCVPLYADVRGLISNRTVGHMYDARTGEFHSTQIGAFSHFEKQVSGDNVYLIGCARIAKRNKAVCKALSTLFADNALKFSFEITCAKYQKLSDGTLEIDVDPSNFLEGMAVVTFPACEDAVALQLVAECLGEGDENMANVNEIENDVAVETAEGEETATEVQNETTEVIAEVASEIEEQTQETEIAETETAATVYVRETDVSVKEVSTYDPETDTETNTRIEVVETTTGPVVVPDAMAEQIQESAEVESVTAEAEEEEEEKEEQETKEEEEEETAACKKKENANYEDVLAELMSKIASIESELKTLTLNKTVSAEESVDPQTEIAEESTEAEVEVHEETAETNVIAEQEDTDKYADMLNPFMASMDIPTKYSLLEKEENKRDHYSLLDRA